jgi:hypothetical protein
MLMEHKNTPEVEAVVVEAYFRVTRQRLSKSLEQRPCRDPDIGGPGYQPVASYFV